MSTFPIKNFYPNFGTVNGGTTVTVEIDGTFLSTSINPYVVFGDAQHAVYGNWVPSLNHPGSNALVAFSPGSGAPGAVEVSVYQDSSMAVLITGPVQFTYTQAPILSGVSTDYGSLSGRLKGGARVTLSGSGFSAYQTLAGFNVKLAVGFGGYCGGTAYPATVIDDSTIVAYTPDVSSIYPSGTQADVVLTAGYFGIFDPNAYSFHNTPYVEYLQGRMLDKLEVPDDRFKDYTKTLPGAFALLPTPAPVASSISPSQDWVQGGESVTISGTNFYRSSDYWKATILFRSIRDISHPDSQYYFFDRQVLTFTVSNDGTTISFLSPPSPYAMKAPGQWYDGRLAAGAVQVIVGTTDGKTMGVFPFSYGDRAATPAVYSVSPNSGSVDGSTPIVIKGSGFVATPTVAFGTASATSVIAVDANTITCLSPAHAVGSVDVTVTNPDAQVMTKASAYSYVSQRPAPVITSDTFITGTVGTGFTYQITATYAAGVSAAVPPFGEQGVLPPGVTFNSTTGLFSGTPTAPGTFRLGLSAFGKHATDQVMVPIPTVLTVTIYSSTDPTISSVDPVAFIDGSSQSIAVTGTGFYDGSSIWVGDGNSFSQVATTYSSSTSLTASGWTVPPYTGLPYYVTVVNPDGRLASPFLPIRVGAQGLCVAPALRFTSLDASGKPVYSIDEKTTGEGDRNKAFGLGTNVETLFYSGLEGNTLLNVYRGQLGTTPTRHGGLTAPGYGDGDLVFKGVLSVEAAPFMVRTMGDDKAMSHLDCSLRSNGQIAMHCYDLQGTTFTDDLERAYANYRALLIRGVDELPVPDIGSDECEFGTLCQSGSLCLCQSGGLY